jgi:hypothetical protein
MFGPLSTTLYWQAAERANQYQVIASWVFEIRHSEETNRSLSERKNFQSALKVKVQDLEVPLIATTK